MQSDSDVLRRDELCESFGQVPSKCTLLGTEDQINQLRGPGMGKGHLKTYSLGRSELSPSLPS